MSMKHIVYFHGFASAPRSTKYTWLKSVGDYEVFAPHVPYNFNQIASLESSIHTWLGSHVSPGDIVLFVGTSLGAYFATLMAHKFDAKALVFNPSVDPKVDLEKYIGTSKNWVTGKDFELTKADVASFRKLDASKIDEKNVKAVISTGDTVVDPAKASKVYTNRVLVPSDDHQFSNKALFLKHVASMFN